MNYLNQNKMEKRAIISECGMYRYRLERVWDETYPKVLFIMLNPSTADAEKDDPTIRRCVDYAKKWGFGGLLVGNLFAFRSTDPGWLLLAENPIGVDNHQHLCEMYQEATKVVCAWGHGKLVDLMVKRFKEYKPLSGQIKSLCYLELAKDGTPKHPLYLKSDIVPKNYQWPPLLNQYYQ